MAGHEKAILKDECLNGTLDLENIEKRLDAVFNPDAVKPENARQTKEAQEHGISNCPECAKGHDNVRTKIYKFNEMDADHVTAWSKGGSTNIENCQMLCKTHNRMKGNK